MGCIWLNRLNVSIFLSLDTDSLSSSSGGLCVLTSDFEAPLVPETFVASDLVESLDVFSELGLEDVGGHLEVFAFLVVLLPVQEPSGDSVSFGIIDDVGNPVALLLGQLTGADTGIDAEDLADQESKSAADSLNLVEGEWHCSFSIDVGVEDTMNVFECILSVLDDQRHLWLKYLIFYNIN